MIGDRKLPLTPDQQHLYAHVLQMVSGPQGELLLQLIAAYPDPLDRGELASRAGVSAASSGFEKNISTLRSFELVDYPTRGQVVALPLLFMEDA